MTPEQLRQMYDRGFLQHELRALVEGPAVFVYQMRQPGTRINLVELIFTPEGILMHGDFTPPAHRGPCGASFKDLAWFAAEMDDDYLAGKFLQKQWTAEAAERHVRGNIHVLREEADYLCGGGDADVKAGILARCVRLEIKADEGDGFECPEDYRLVWEDEFDVDGSDSEWVYPQHNYDPAGVAALAAIHARFRELFWTCYERIDRTEDGLRLIAHAPSL